MKGIRVPLDASELALCKLAGEERQRRALERGYREWGLGSAETHARGVACELALAKWLGCFYTPRLDPDHNAGDVGNLEVRSSRRKTPELHLRVARDVREGVAFVLVAIWGADVEAWDDPGDALPLLTVCGWEWSHIVLKHGAPSTRWGVATRCMVAAQLQPPDTIPAVFYPPRNRWPAQT